jgi:tetratricopeptide (TPR) repeat protein
MKNRVIVFALTVLGCGLTLSAQRMTLDNPLEPLSQTSSQQHTPNSRQDSSITGTIQDMNNQRLKDVRVELRDGNGSVVSSTSTDSSGNFEFAMVTSANYIVVATSGMDQVTEHVQVAGWSNMVNLRMPVRTPQDGMAGSSTVSVAQYKISGKARDEFNKARAAMEKNKTEEASKHLARALELSPDYADALTLRGILKMDQKDVAGAVSDVDKAIHADPNCAMAYMVMASALNSQFKYDEAIRSLQHAEPLAPNSWQLHFEMGKSYIGKADYPSALHQFDMAQNMTTSGYPVVSLMRGYTLLKMKQYPQAADALQAYLQKDPQGSNSQQAQKLLEQAQAFMAKK